MVLHSRLAVPAVPDSPGLVGITSELLALWPERFDIRTLRSKT